MLNKIFRTGILGAILLFFLSTFVSCEKNKETIAVIIVEDNDGNFVSGATVVLQPESSFSLTTGLPTDSDLRKTDITDSNGRAEFTYKLPAILGVYVTKISGNDTLKNNLNNIVLLREKTVTKRVTIN